MEIGVCVKRVPMVGGKIVLTADEQEVDTRMSGFTISPHEECAVEEAVQITERLGGTVSVLTLGPPAAADQLRESLALGAGRAVLLETDGREWGPMATAAEIVAEVRRRAAEGLRKQALRVPESSQHQAEVLGNGVDAVPELVRVLDEMGMLS